jgi:hypothetical protein
MGLLAWVTMGIALWHFAIFLPDRFYGGIVGSFGFALIGSVLVGFVVSGFQVPGIDDTTILTALEGVPGALGGLALAYWLGVRRGNVALDL